MINYGELIKRVRKDKELTQTQVADICGVTQAAIGRIEAGAIKSIGIEMVAALYDHLGVDPYLFIIPGYPYLYVSENKQARYEAGLKQLYSVMHEKIEIEKEIKPAASKKQSKAKA